MEHERNGLPENNFCIGSNTRDESRRIKEILDKYYPLPMNKDAKLGFNASSPTFYYGVLPDNTIHGAWDSKRFGKAYTLKEFEELIKIKDSVINTYPIF